MADIHNYAFIDGNYLRRAYEDTLRKYFPDAAGSHIDLGVVKNALGASKVFYYDSVDEDAPDAEGRKTSLDVISALNGFHVRQGTLNKKGQQKQVDVQLAVDALTHAFSKNYWHATLIAGDLDFKPLVEALIHLGAHVHIYYDPHSASKPLYRAADVAVPITLNRFWQWSNEAYREAHPIPSSSGNTDLPNNAAMVKDRVGLWDGRPIALYRSNDPHYHALFAPPHRRNYSHYVTYTDSARLIQYFELEFGKIEWE